MFLGYVTDYLRDRGYDFEHKGYNGAEFYSIKQCFKLSEAIDSDVLYIILKEIYQDIEYVEGISFIVVEDSAVSKKLFADAENLLIEHNRSNSYLLRLQKGIVGDMQFGGIVDICAEIMQAPCIAIGFSGITECRKEVWNVSSDSVKILSNECLNVMFTNTTEISLNPFSKALVATISFNGLRYTLCSILNNNNDLISYNNFERIIDIFSSTIRKKRSTSLDEAIVDMLKNKSQANDATLSELTRLGFKAREKYYVLAIAKKNNELDEAIKSDLAKLLKKGVYDVYGYYVAIMYSEKNVEYTEKNFPTLNKYLQDNLLLGFISMGTINIKDCHMRLEQIINLLEYNSKKHVIGLKYYARYQITHLVSTLNAEGKYNLKDFCHPIVLELYEIDKSKNKDYLSTLFTYICSGQSVKQTSLSMNIHVNTIYMRVNKLREEFNIDFEDAHLMYSIHNSIVLLGIYEPNPIKNFYPFLD